MKFTKMQGIGNDYVYVNCFEEHVEDPAHVAQLVSERHFGIGSDGLILICPSEVADCRMRMFNEDGSEGSMCGNGIRCVGKYAYDHGIVDKPQISVETLGGIKYLDMRIANGKVKTVKVDMGIPQLTSELPEKIQVDGKKLEFTGIDVGNPHAVYYVDDVDSLDLEKIGPSFEHHPLFPDRVNTEFVRVIDAHTLQMRVWERGSGETFACGTGTCATVVAAVLNGYCKKEEEILVHLRGGDLRIIYHEDDTVTMIGPATYVFEGKMEYPKL